MAGDALQLLLERFARHHDGTAMIWHDQAYSYGWLLQEIERWRQWLHQQHIVAGTVLLLEGDYSPHVVAMLLALWIEKIIVVPYAPASAAHRTLFIEISQAEAIVSITGDEAVAECTRHKASHRLYDVLRAAGHGGLVLMSSGTSGPSKGIVHDITRFLAKVERMKTHPQRILAFLIFDHLGGLDTLVYSLATAGTLVVPATRTPDDALAAIEKHGVEVLPTSPSFLNLVLISGAWQRYRLDSLKKISYGSEPMPQDVLARYHAILPHAKLTQTYGISEVGVMRSISESSESLWMRVGGSDYDTRVVEGVLQVHSPYMMLGYLNAPDTMTDDGWFITGDLVDTSGDYIRIKGRASEVINVGGEKVYPLEVEDVIRQLTEVADVVVYGESNPILGQIVAAKVVPKMPFNAVELRNLVRQHCLKLLPKYKAPVRIEITTQPLTAGDRAKKRRRSDGGQAGNA